MASPIILAVLPMIHMPEIVETLLIAMSILIGVLTISAGYREHHKERVLVLLVFSVAFLVGKYAVPERLETPMVVAGALLMAGAQFMNLRLQRGCCHHDHCEAETSRNELSSIASRVEL
jgi:uncharacterized membrane protein YozB (DUF420 family)